MRDRKRRAVQIALLSFEALSSVQAVVDPAAGEELKAIFETVVKMSPDTPDHSTAPTSRRLLQVFEEASPGNAPVGGTVDEAAAADGEAKSVAASTLLCLLAAITRRSAYFEQPRTPSTCERQRRPTQSPSSG